MVIFRKVDVQPGERHKPEPLTWHFEYDHKGKLQPDVVCANGHEASITEHTIASDGTINPSLDCPADGCDFHDHGKLDGWVSRLN